MAKMYGNLTIEAWERAQKLFECGLKWCGICSEVKPLDEFHNDKSKLGGKASKCKACAKEYARRPEVRAKQRERQRGPAGKAAQKRHRQTDKGKEYARKYKQSPKYRKWSAEYSRRPEVQARQRAARLRDPERFKDYDRRYKCSKKGRATGLAYRKRRQKEKPEQKLAGCAVNYAIKAGGLPPVKSLTCQECGKQAMVYHHHLGYEKGHRLDVVPLCHKCHSAAHR